ncbi:hypothetical protein A8A54_13485 [Brucella pseudogrignonensis]|uniref:hypothetical protein n=1 Tax=Brucella pseudogrignonensis TaxID=419475 RepID=UPI0007DA5E93|nr:hypothetical protein [Brucella pseudogrignonensis]ANG97396.1 hypothetical protein A8A54_13485 [Brucella pseudogrignonensis]
MRGADILVQMLIGYGVETIFGVPGDLERLAHVLAQGKACHSGNYFSCCERSKTIFMEAGGLGRLEAGRFNIFHRHRINLPQTLQFQSTNL